MTAAVGTPEWLQKQVAGYQKSYGRYKAYAVFLESALKHAAREVAPLAIVQARPKSIASFAEKALRKQKEVTDPLTQFTDLCGVRVITRTRSEVEAVCQWIEHSFEIDWANTDDTAERLRSNEFGYRSVHFIVSLLPDKALGTKVPPSVFGLKAELQVRTMLEHANADFTHDLYYKREFDLPLQWERELAVIAAELEDVDRAFTRVEAGLRVYKTSYGAFHTKEEISDERAIFETVLEYDDKNPTLAWQAGKLSMALGDWRRAARVMSPFVSPKTPELAYQPLLRDLGVSLCKLGESNPQGRTFKRGQRYLDLAGEPPHRDPDALAALAGTWKGVDESRVHDLYRRAFELDPADYYALTNYLECELRRIGDTSGLAALRPTIENAISRCRAHAQVGINLPWALLSLAELKLLIGEPEESILAYASAIAMTTGEWMFVGALESIERLSPVREELTGYAWAEMVLLTGFAAKFPSKVSRDSVIALASSRRPIGGPIVVVVGGTAASTEEATARYQPLLLQAFGDFAGTIVSGGTPSGVARIAGEIGEQSGGRIRTIGYLPRRLPRGISVDRSYTEIRRTDGDGFNLSQPLQYWVDILASGIDPAAVTVLAVGGGEITSVELRLALALGASVGVVVDSGGATARLLSDPDWATSVSLAPIHHDPETARAFIGSGRRPLDVATRETLAELIHHVRRDEDVARLSSWNGLPDRLRQSSRNQADHIATKLARLGYEMQPTMSREVKPITFTPGEVEVLAEIEHGRWNAEQLMGGWRFAPDWNETLKTDPGLVPWADLHEEIRERARAVVRRIPAALAAAGFEISASPRPHSQRDRPRS